MLRRMALLAALALVATAQAGTPDAPEIVDAADDTRGPALHGDILAGWLEDADAEGVTTAIRVAQLDPSGASRWSDHYFVFRVGDVAVCTFVYLDQAGAPQFYACHWDERTRFQQDPAEPTDGALEPGAPGVVRARFPWALLAAPPSPPFALTDLRVETFDFKRPLPGAEPEALANPFLVDQATSDARFLVGDPPAPAPAPAQAAVPGPASLAAVAALALAASRRRAPGESS